MSAAAGHRMDVSPSLWAAKCPFFRSAPAECLHLVPLAPASRTRRLVDLGSTEGATARSFPVRDAEGFAAMVAHVIPIRLTARDIFARSAGVLVLTPVTLPNAPSIAVVQSLAIWPRERRSRISQRPAARPRTPFAPRCAAFWKRPAVICRRMSWRCSRASRRRD